MNQKDGERKAPRHSLTESQSHLKARVPSSKPMPGGSQEDINSKDLTMLKDSKSHAIAPEQTFPLMVQYPLQALYASQTQQTFKSMQSPGTNMYLAIVASLNSAKRNHCIHISFCFPQKRCLQHQAKHSLSQSTSLPLIKIRNARGKKSYRNLSFLIALFSPVCHQHQSHTPYSCPVCFNKGIEAIIRLCVQVCSTHLSVIQNYYLPLLDFQRFPKAQPVTSSVIFNQCSIFLPIYIFKRDILK